MKYLQEIDLAWLAGFLDGEGYISFRPTKTGNSDRYMSFRVIVTMTGKDKAFMQKVSEFSGGSLREIKRGEYGPYYDCRLYGPPAVEFLRCVLPYLRLKKRLAEECIRAYEALHSYNLKYPGKPVEIQELLRRWSDVEFISSIQSSRSKTKKGGES